MSVRSHWAGGVQPGTLITSRRRVFVLGTTSTHQEAGETQTEREDHGSGPGECGEDDDVRGEEGVGDEGNGGDGSRSRAGAKKRKVGRPRGSGRKSEQERVAERGWIPPNRADREVEDKAVKRRRASLRPRKK